MTASEHRLPVEVWINVFDQIQDKKQLIQCKLVCKRWTPLVEKALLKRAFLTDINTPELYQYLVKYPTSSRHIQEIYISSYDSDNLSDIRAFLTVAMTPNLKAIRIGSFTNKIRDILVDVASQWPPNYLKLERMPVTLFNNEAYDSMVYQFRKTLQFLVVGFSSKSNLDSLKYITSNANQFESLTNLQMNDHINYIDNIPKLDSILKGCPGLRDLTLRVDMSPRRCSYQGNLDAWLAQNVNKVNSLKTIFIHSAFRPDQGYDANTFGLFHVDLFQYLSFKYPKVEILALDSYEQRKQPIFQSLFKNAKTVKLMNWRIENIDHVQDMIDIWKSKSNSLKLGYNYPTYPWGCNCEISAIKRDNHTQFTLARIPWTMPVERIRQLVLSLSRTLTKDFEISLSGDQLQNVEHIRNPLTFLQFTPFIKRLTVQCGTLGQKQLLLPPLARLHTLEFSNVNLTSKDMADIASWAPHLKHITFTYCEFTKDLVYTSDLLDQNIHLPDFALDTLTIKGELLRRDLRIVLAIANSQPQLFYTAPYRPIVRTTLEEIERHTNVFTTISIECKSLKHFSARLKSWIVEMEFDGKGNVIESKPAIENSTIIQLEQDLQSLINENALLKTERQAAITNYQQAKKYLTKAQIQSIEKHDV